MRGIYIISMSHEVARLWLRNCNEETYNRTVGVEVDSYGITYEWNVELVMKFNFQCC
jgi:hypothetical protein